MKILYPPIQDQLTQGKIIFLAGPIQGTYDWQANFAKNMENYNVSIANPRRMYMDGTFNYIEQVNWETCFLNKADIIIFWLAKEIEVIPGRVYAQTTRFEIGEWLGKSKHLNKKILVGIDDGFSGARYIRTRINENYNHVPIVNTFEQLLEKTQELV